LEEESYGVAGRRELLREEHTHGGLTVGNWVTAGLRYEFAAGLDSWDRARRAVASGLTLEQRLWNDGLSIGGTLSYWSPLSNTKAFHAHAIRIGYSSTSTAKFVAIARLGVETASGDAPLSVWPGAGEGRARPQLLRAHPLLGDGAI